MLVEAMKKGAVGGKLVGQEDRLERVEEESEAQVLSFHALLVQQFIY